MSMILFAPRGSENTINEVVKTIVEAVVIVIVVIFLFLGSLRSVLIPAVTVP
ncbi:efflux RND transporter permease subunit, partial [Dermacoccus nishinomiyaensis]|uniref:efflux RND transporter permease subunit n=1 Tax=Dermacoccus nishinomiyaensis TaxID=1274 RepID=UPI003CD0C753